MDEGGLILYRILSAGGLTPKGGVTHKVEMEKSSYLPPSERLLPSAVTSIYVGMKLGARHKKGR
jgi:hypothetical protein